MSLPLDQIICGDNVEVMRTMPDKCVQTCITSPPYFGLRDYGHEGQIGLEATPDAFVVKLVDVFREVRRLLRDDGTLWLNLGDSYASNTKGDSRSKEDKLSASKLNLNRDVSKAQSQHDISGVRRVDCGLASKQLIGIPWRVAFALQSDGWYLRQDIIWHKPNPMPESVTDRCTKSHEYIFLLSKSAKYYFDADAIKEPLKQSSVIRNQSGWNGNEDRDWVNGKQNNMSKYLGSDKAKNETHRNRRSVWTVNTKPYKAAHFATYPPKLIEPCVLAGCPEGGVVLDPFSGAATTAMVARNNGRRYIGIELNPEYVAISQQRLSQGVLF